MQDILSRRSIRRFRTQPVSDHDIKELLRAGMAAPSAGNEQPWHFIVINERSVLDEIPRFHNYASAVNEAPAAILACGQPELEKYKGNWTLDCSAATENILIAAQSKHLGAIWIGVYPEENLIDDMRNLLEIPENIIPFALIPVGYPDENKPPQDRYSESRVHYNQW